VPNPPGFELKPFQGFGPNFPPLRSQTEQRPFLGVGLRELEPAERELADLPEGVGLVVEFVEADSPAAEAGMVAGDVLHKVGDQLVINLAQLTTLTRLAGVEEPVAFTVVRGGEPTELTASLVEREVPVAPQLQYFGLRPLPDVEGLRLQPRGRLERSFRVGPREFRMPLGNHAADTDLKELLEQIEALRVEMQFELDDEAIEEAVRSAREAAEQARRQRGDLEAMLDTVRNNMDQNRLQLETLRPQFLQQGMTAGTNVVIRDDDGTAALTIDGDKRTVTVADADGNTLFEGDWPTDEDRTKLPKVVQDRLDRLEQYVPQVQPDTPDAPRRPETAPQRQRPSDVRV
jgi:hypothetical protein